MSFCNRKFRLSSTLKGHCFTVEVSIYHQLLLASVVTTQTTKTGLKVFATMSNLQRTPPRTVNNAPNKRLKRDEEGDTDITLNSAVNMLMSQFRETREMIDDFRKDINNKIDAVKTELEGKLNLVTQEIGSFKLECAAKFGSNDVALSTMHERVDQLSHTIGNLQNRSELIISGIPFSSEEKLSEFFVAMCRQLGFDGDAYPAVDVRRMKARATLKDGDECLIAIQFALRNSRDDFYNAYLRTRDLKLRHLGLESDRRIYVNENLTVTARKVKVAALRLKKAGKLSSVYTKQGVVHVKSTAESHPVVVNSEKDLVLFS